MPRPGARLDHVRLPPHGVPDRLLELPRAHAVDDEERGGARAVRGARPGGRLHLRDRLRQAAAWQWPQRLSIARGRKEIGTQAWSLRARASAAYSPRTSTVFSADCIATIGPDLGASPPVGSAAADMKEESPFLLLTRLGSHGVVGGPANSTQSPHDAMRRPQRRGWEARRALLRTSRGAPGRRACARPARPPPRRMASAPPGPRGSPSARGVSARREWRVMLAVSRSAELHFPSRWEGGSSGCAPAPSRPTRCPPPSRGACRGASPPPCPQPRAPTPPRPPRSRPAPPRPRRRPRPPSSAPPSPSTTAPTPPAGAPPPPPGRAPPHRARPRQPAAPPR